MEWKHSGMELGNSGLGSSGFGFGTVTFYEENGISLPNLLQQNKITLKSVKD